MRYLEFLGGQRVPERGVTTTARLARGAQLPFGLVSPSLAAERVESIAGRPQRSSGFSRSTTPAEPAPMGKQQATALKGPTAHVCTESGIERLGGIVVIGKHRMGEAQVERACRSGRGSCSSLGSLSVCREPEGQ